MQMNLNLKEETKENAPKILLQNKKPMVLEEIPEDCVVVDIETTGFSAINDSIIEISALKIVQGKVQEEFSSLVKPKKKLPPFISKLTGITPDMVENAPDIKIVLEKFCNFIQTNPIVGHNIKFDLSFLNKKLEETYEKTLPNDFLDTLTFARRVYQNLSSHKLTNIAQHLKIDTKNAHRALNDCYMTYKIMEDMKEKL